MPDSAPSVRLVAGQLAYLFEDDPDLRSASDDDIARRLSHDDRFARARQEDPLASDAEVAKRAKELEDRITPEIVREARTQIPK